MKNLILTECTEKSRTQLVNNAIKNDKIYSDKTPELNVVTLEDILAKYENFKGLFKIVAPVKGK
jgi:hypothetical protein